MQYLARREYSRFELSRKLQPYVEPGEEASLEDLLQEFQAHGWLSDERFTEQMVHARQKKFGALRIKHELKEKGVPEALIDAAMTDVREQEAAHAREIWERKFGQPAADAQERARQVRFLQSRGFSLDTVFKVIGQRAED
jgi:regulatory protein